MIKWEQAAKGEDAGRYKLDNLKRHMYRYLHKKGVEGHRPNGGNWK